MTFNVDSNIAILVIVWLIVQVLKPTKINNHLLPLIAVIVGALVAIGLSLYIKDTQLVQDIVLGVWAGFASTGLNETATKSITSIIEGFANGFGKVEDKKTE
ncbi:phage holin family protein [Leuconostoc suionicum]|uniref:phage holin family protein n=1 Tax=Leuconostoc suionicum TaxID=1511761 RepID=UPI0032DF330C